MSSTMIPGCGQSWGHAPAAISQQHGSSRETSGWMPSLKKLNKSFFAKSSVPQKSEIGKPEPTHTASSRPLMEIHQRRMNERNARPVIAPQGSIDCGNSSVLRNKRPTPLELRSPKETSSFNRIKRPFSKSSSKKSPLQSPQEPMFAMRDVEKREVEIISAGAPQTVTYVPLPFVESQELHASEQQKRSSTKSHKPAPIQIPAKTAAYVPKHAASDFAKLNLPFALDSNGLASPPTSPTTTEFDVPMKSFSDAEFDDYQRFMVASRMAAARSYNSHVIMNANNFTPKTSALMQDIITNHQSMESRRSSASRPVTRAGSIFDRVTDYYKPNRASSLRSKRTGFSRPGSVRSQSTDLTSVNGSSVRGKSPPLDLRSGFDDDDERRSSMWSRASGSLIRSFSRDRNSSGYELCDRVRQEKGAASGMRNRKMPISPGMKKFNKALKRGHFESLEEDGAVNMYDL